VSDAYDIAMGLLLGEAPSPEAVREAAALLESASTAGHAEASERLALLDAVGAVRPPDWGRSLDFLTLAAKQGSRPAQGQLLLLADWQSDPAIPAAADDAFWDKRRAEVVIAERIRPPSKQSLSESPRIRAFRGFLSRAQCRWLVAFARPRLVPARVFNHETGEQMLHPTRDNSSIELRVGEMNVMTEVIRNRIAAAANLPVPLFEPAQVLHYAIGQRFKPHHDFLDPANPAYRDSIATFGQRIATFLIYLNDGYEGGETCFPNIGLNFRAAAGDALLFANVHPDGTPDVDTLHAGEPPTSGEKWVFSQWIRDRFPGR
jgi:prolyl 4-hydroxylase